MPAPALGGCPLRSAPARRGRTCRAGAARLVAAMELAVDRHKADGSCHDMRHAQEVGVGTSTSREGRTALRGAGRRTAQVEPTGAPSATDQLVAGGHDGGQCDQVPDGAAGIVAGLAGVASLVDDAALAARAARLSERIEDRRFHIGILGDFKRGKSTLVNALIGRTVLPSGVVPVTTVVTEVRFGAGGSGAVVDYADGTTETIDERVLAEYVSEERNPGNRRGVARVVVSVPETLGAPGVVLVDTPGLGSVHEHQTAAARYALADSDGAVVVLSADSPLSDTEHALVVDLVSRGAPLFVVVNKCDHLGAPELDAVGTYVAGQLGRSGVSTAPFLVSARRALDATGDRGFDAFEQALASFVRDELDAARQATAVAELGRLAARMAVAFETERAAAELGTERLHAQIAAFETAAAAVRSRFADDRLVLDHEVDELVRSVGDALAQGAAAAAAEQWPAVLAAVRGARGRQLDQPLDEAVTEAVRRGIEPLRLDAERSLDLGWAALAERFARGTQEHADRLREVASELFDVRFPPASVPSVAGQPRRFSYLFLHVESPGTSLARALMASLPLGWGRRRALERARRRLSAELDKHAGRVRYDLAQRLHEVQRGFVATMSAELDDVERSIADATDRARSLLGATRQEQRERTAVRARALALVHEIGEMAGGARSRHEAAALLPADRARPAAIPAGYPAAAASSPSPAPSDPAPSSPDPTPSSPNQPPMRWYRSSP